MFYDRTNDILPKAGSALACWGGRIFHSSDKLMRHDKTWLWIITPEGVLHHVPLLVEHTDTGKKLLVTTAPVVKILTDKRKGRLVKLSDLRRGEQAEDIGWSVQLAKAYARPVVSASVRLDIMRLLDGLLGKAILKAQAKKLLFPDAYLCFKSSADWQDKYVLRDDMMSRHADEPVVAGSNRDGVERWALRLDQYDGPGVVAVDPHRNNRWQCITWPNEHQTESTRTELT